MEVLHFPASFRLRLWLNNSFKAWARVNRQSLHPKRASWDILGPGRMALAPAEIRVGSGIVVDVLGSGTLCAGFESPT